MTEGKQSLCDVTRPGWACAEMRRSDREYAQLPSFLRYATDSDLGQRTAQSETPADTPNAAVVLRGCDE